MDKINFKFFTVIIILSFSATIKILPQDFGKLRGIVIDSSSRQTLAFANVYIEKLNTGASTDLRGYFLINNIPARKEFTALVSYMGYRSKRITFKVKKGEITDTTIELFPSSYQLQAIEKIGKRVMEENETDIGLQKITLRQLEKLPKGVETDVFRALQYLPGVKSTGDISAKYYVRGGTSDQNLVMLNGITIYNPFHALGLFSAIDPEIISGVEFYKGGFMSEYGGRLSSVLDIKTKEGNKSVYSAKAASSFLSGKILLEGPVPDGSFMVTGRKSFSNQILKKFLNDQNAPIDFYDMSFKLNYSSNEFLDRANFSLFGLFTGDKLKYADPARESFEWSNNLIGVEWFQIYDAPLFSKVSVSSSGFSGEVIPNESNLKPRSNKVNDVTASADFTYVFDSKDEYGGGFDFKIVSADLYTQNKRGVEANIKNLAGYLSLYNKFKLLRYNNFGVDAGFRLNYGGVSESGNFNIEPRLSATFRIIPQIAVKAAAGIYHQWISTITDENEVISIFEPWFIHPEYLEPSSAVHYTAGIDLDLTDEILFKVETYYKELTNMPVINEDKNFGYEHDFTTGSGESYGWEFSFQYNTLPINILSSYSLSWAYKTVNDYIYYPRYDIRHSVNFGIDCDLGWGISASAMWTYSSGLPFTKIMSYYEKLHFDNVYESPFYSGYYFPFTVLGDKNFGRLPVYHKLDLSLSKKIVISPVVIDVNVSVINAYNRKNIFYFKRETGERVNMLPFLPTATLKVEL
jgi:hypothetical protein